MFLFENKVLIVAQFGNSNPFATHGCIDLNLNSYIKHSLNSCILK